MSNPAATATTPVSDSASGGEDAWGVSVVITAYNYAHYLPFTIDAALAQDHALYEIIVVDDGSKDNTAEVVRAYGERVRYVFQQNAGLSAARNTGIREAQYPFVTFLDADDVPTPGMLKRAVEAFQRLGPEFAIVGGKYRLIDSTGRDKPVNLKDQALAGELTAEHFLLKNRIAASSAVVRKSVFGEVGGYDTTLTSSEDRDMWIRIGKHHRAYLLSETQMLVRRHPNNMSRHAYRMRSNMRCVIRKAWRDRVVPHARFAYWLRVYSFWFYQSAILLHAEHRAAAALRDLLCSLVLWPWFPRPDELDQPTFFRVRSLVRFLRESLLRGGAGRASP